MIISKRGSILNTDVDAILNPVDCIGTLERGILMDFKRKYPNNFKYYKAACNRGMVRVGKVLVFKVSHFTKPNYIINFPVRNHWRDKINVLDIKGGLVDLIDNIDYLGIESIAIPPIGRYSDSLDWKSVKKLITRVFINHKDIKVILYEP